MAGFEFVPGLFCHEIDKPFSDQLVRRSAIFTKQMVFFARTFLGLLDNRARSETTASA
jgi:hypothetical protein